MKIVESLSLSIENNGKKIIYFYRLTDKEVWRDFPQQHVIQVIRLLLSFQSSYLQSIHAVVKKAAWLAA